MVRDDAAQSLESYLAFAEASQRGMQVRSFSVSGARDLAKRFVPRGSRRATRLVATRSVSRREAGRAARLHRPLLHLGSGGEHKVGWVNIDLLGDPVDIAWDLSRPLPFADASAAGVFHEHLLEHLPLRAALALTRECRRVLEPGAVLRVGVPDAGMLARSYADDGVGLEAYCAGRPTRMLALQETFYWHDHVTMYDEETLTLLLRTAGFADVQRRSFGETALPVTADTEARRHGTLYVESHA